MAAAVRTKRLRWSMFWALVSYAVTTLGAALASYLTSFDVTPIQGSLISTGVGLGVVMIGAFIDHARNSGYVDPAPARYQDPRTSKPAGRTSFAAALVLMLVLCGGGGLAITYGAHWVAQKFVGAMDDMKPPWEQRTEEPGVRRLAKPVSKQSGILTVTINAVEVNSEVTMINITATNSGNESISMPRAQLSVPGSNTLQPDHAVSEFLRGSAPAGGELTGTIVFDGVVGGHVTKVTLAFTSIHSFDFDAPRNISIDIPLTGI